MTRPLPEHKKQVVGRKSDFSKDKAAQLEWFAPLYQQCRDTGTQASFYDKITQWCVTHWGYDAKELVRDGPVIELKGEPSLEVDENAILDMEAMSEQDVEEHATYFQTMRTVMHVHYSFKINTKTYS